MNKPLDSEETIREIKAILPKRGTKARNAIADEAIDFVLRLALAPASKSLNRSLEEKYQMQSAASFIVKRWIMGDAADAPPTTIESDALPPAGTTRLLSS